MSPIFIRPVREQLEHDRLIRHLALKYKKKSEVSVNIGDEQTAPVKLGANTFYPDLVMTDGKRLVGLVEVETGESVNNLEAMAQWVHFARAKVPFHLYVPVQGYDAARRLCDLHGIRVAEVWTYRASLDSFDLVRSYADPAAEKLGPARTAETVAKPVKAAIKPASPAKPVPASKPAPQAKPSAGARKALKPASKPGKTSKPVTKSAKSQKLSKKAKPPARKSAKPAVKKASSTKKKAGRGR